MAPSLIFGIEDTPFADKALNDYPVVARIQIEGMTYESWKRGGDNRMVLNLSNENFSASCEMVNDPATNIGFLSVKIEDPRDENPTVWSHTQRLEFDPLKWSLLELLREFHDRRLDKMRFLQVDGVPSGQRFWVREAISFLRRDSSFDSAYAKEAAPLSQVLHTAYLSINEPRFVGSLRPIALPGLFFTEPNNLHDRTVSIMNCDLAMLDDLMFQTRDKLGWQLPQWYRELHDQEKQLKKANILDEMDAFWPQSLRDSAGHLFETIQRMPSSAYYSRSEGLVRHGLSFSAEFCYRYEEAARMLDKAYKAKTAAEKLALCHAVIICMNTDASGEIAD